VQKQVHRCEPSGAVDELVALGEPVTQVFPLGRSEVLGVLRGEQQVGELFGVLDDTDAVVAQDVAVRPQLVDQRRESLTAVVPPLAQRRLSVRSAR